jgi:hypothetical protein
LATFLFCFLSPPVGLGYERQIKRLELKLQESDDKTTTIEKKVKKMHASNILQKVLGMMHPKGKKTTPMGNKLLEMAALKKANAQLADVQSVSSGWPDEHGDPINNATNLNLTVSQSDTRSKLSPGQQTEIKAYLSVVDGEVTDLRKKYVDLKIQVDDEMMMERKRHEAHLTEMKEDVNARHEEELEIQRQDWEERTDLMREQYESQLSRISDTHSKVQDQLHEAHAVTSVLQAHKLQAEEMMNNNISNSLSILSEGKNIFFWGWIFVHCLGLTIIFCPLRTLKTESSTPNTEALEEHTRRIAKTHEHFHHELLQVKQMHHETREDMNRKILETKEHVIEMTKLAVLEHADKHIKEILSNFQNDGGKTTC